MKKYLPLVALVLASLALCSPLAAIESASECQQAEQAWLAANWNKLPTSYGEILAFPDNERRIAFRHVDAATKSAIWRGHYAAVAAQSDLDPAQRELVVRAGLASTPELFALRSSDPAAFAIAAAPLQQVLEEAKARFSPEKIHAIFFSLGLQGGDQEGRPTQRVLDCNCASSFDCGGNNCRGVFCTPQEFGCGGNFLEPCWGRC